MKNISIFGKGNMATALQNVFSKAGNPVQLIGRNETTTLGDIVIFALPYASVADVASQYQAELKGKIVVDITNPVDFGTMDGLVVGAETSAAEEIAKLLPDSDIIKAFNTNFATPLGEGKAQVFIAGDNDTAKQILIDALNGSGVTTTDAGTLKRARELEALGLLLITLAVREQIGWGDVLEIR